MFISSYLDIIWFDEQTFSKILLPRLLPPHDKLKRLCPKNVRQKADFPESVNTVLTSFCVVHGSTERLIYPGLLVTPFLPPPCYPHQCERPVSMATRPRERRRMSRLFLVCCCLESECREPACDSRVATAQGPLLIFSAGAAAQEQYGPYGPHDSSWESTVGGKSLQSSQETAVQLCIRFIQTDKHINRLKQRMLHKVYATYSNSFKLLLAATKYKKKYKRFDANNLFSNIGSICYYNHF